ALERHMATGDRAGAFTAATRNLRLLLQSAMLGLGAWLTLRGALTPGLMIAGSVLLARSLTPVETMLAHWPAIQRGREGWRQLAALLDRAPQTRPGLALPRPAARLDLSDVSLAPPGQRRASLRGISLQLAPGQILGVIGPSGAGKTTLARALAGLSPLLGGQIQLGGAPLDQYPPDLYGRWIGYLPQQITLFPATIAQNIARLDPDPDPDAVLAAARRAGAHEMILALPRGYDSVIGPGGTGLSGGESQRIALARALYGDPVLLILDEANAHLDHPGSEALNAALRATRAAGGIAVTLAHRPSALRECDLLLILDGGRARAFGPRDAVLRAAGLAPVLPAQEGAG
ncbi:ATP-binding cassette domain-containing protein, partial [Thioclava sp. BHET1]